MEPFRVFISSIMDPAVEDLLGERAAARNAVEHFAPITKPWAFEAEPASTTPLLDFYLGAVKTCDLFVIIVGRSATSPVKAECQTALDYRKPILAFRKNVPSGHSDGDELLRSLGSKWDSFTHAAELREQLRTAVGMELLRLIRSDDQPVDGQGSRVARLRRLASDGTGVRISPLVPDAANALFSVAEVQPQMVVFEKQSSRQSVGVPLQRVAEILDQGNGEAPRVILRGRLQWLTLKQEWAFCPDPPVEQLGVPREVHFGSEAQLMASINGNGKVPFVSRLDQLAKRLGAGTHEVFYDDHSYYLRQRAHDTDSVLVVER